jgi:hypothetical protein
MLRIKRRRIMKLSYDKGLFDRPVYLKIFYLFLNKTAKEDKLSRMYQL